MIHLSPDGGAMSPLAARLSLPHSCRGGTPLSLQFAFRRARLAALGTVTISEHTPWGVRLLPQSAASPIEMHRDPIGAGLSRCSRCAVVYSSDRDEVSLAAAARVRGAAAHD
jgi:hypothetical protein